MWTHLYGIDPTDADSLTACSIEGRKQVHEAVQVLKESEDERFKDLFVASTGPALAIREGRRIHGLYTLTVDDLRERKQFEDGICEIRFNIDIHDVDPAEGGRVAVPSHCLPSRSDCSISNRHDGCQRRGRGTETGGRCTHHIPLADSSCRGGDRAVARLPTTFHPVRRDLRGC